MIGSSALSATLTAVSVRLFILVFLGYAWFELSAAVSFPELSKNYQQTIQPLLKKYCLDCHSTDKEMGELDWERCAKLDDVRTHPKVWQKVVEMMEDGEMPP